MSNKISVQQRKYFSQRVTDAMNAKISVLKHKNASRVTELGNKQFENYLKDIGVYDKLMRFAVVKNEADELNKTIRQIYENIRKALNIGEYQSNWPTIYQGSEALESKKSAALDKLHGIDALDGLMLEVNKILTGAGVPQLGA